MNYRERYNAFLNAQTDYINARSIRADIQNRLITARAAERAALDTLNNIPGAIPLVPPAPIPNAPSTFGAVLSGTGGGFNTNLYP